MWQTTSLLLLSSLNDSVPNSSAMAAENPDPSISLYYQTRAAHHGVVTSDWLDQAKAASGSHPDDADAKNLTAAEDIGEVFSVVDEFNNWRKLPELAEAVAAIRSLASVIRSSNATTMMELEIELKKAADSLKVGVFCTSYFFSYCSLQIRKRKMYKFRVVSIFFFFT